ncbi:hypothetical protein MIT9_P0901 [Methylomarinovum caldicuralii]|uniref:Uncharacterized protein n=1 Tax=Methylomarinovum caldicuralii TaxID=438856 RepID=A0AAU9CN22_9GAMM|nr:hypothetical protein [Methylomarinovum caldicuralii]BCX81323.1 hypothetical protein MIT9_P0901 [Methylomarinovum caldicuralii]
MPEISRFFGIVIAMFYSLVMEWAARHQSELMDNWQRAERYAPLKPIPPLE